MLLHIPNNLNTGGRAILSTPPIRNAAIHEPIQIENATLGPRSFVITPTVAMHGTNSVMTIIAVSACAAVMETSVNPNDAKSRRTIPRTNVVAMRGSDGR